MTTFDRTRIDKMRRGLGWFSVALGTAELLTPRFVAKFVGAVPSARTSLMLRLAGLRELGAGMALLFTKHPLPVWLRVAGDALDLGMIGAAATARRANGTRLASAAAAVSGVAALDAFAALRATRLYEATTTPTIFATTIARSPREVYDFFRDFERLPEFMEYVASVEQLDRTRSRWTARLPMGKTVSWTAEIVEERPGELIAWKTTDDTPFSLEGRITFTHAPARDSTEVRAELKVGARGRGSSVLLAKLVARPEIKGDLRRLKQVLETGEVLCSDASEHMLPHPAQPASADEHIHKPMTFIPTPPQATKGAEQ